MTTPTEPGYYWYKDAVYKNWIVLRTNGVYILDIFSEVTLRQDDFTGEWGPKISPPDKE